MFSFRFKPKVKRATEKLRFVRCICIGNLIIVVHLVSRLEIWFPSATFITFSHRSLTHFPFKLLQSENSLWRWIFAFDRCEVVSDFYRPTISMGWSIYREVSAVTGKKNNSFPVGFGDTHSFIENQILVRRIHRVKCRGYDTACRGFYH